MTKANRYISLMLSILIATTSGIFLYMTFVRLNIPHILHYANLDIISMILYVILIFILSIFSIVFNTKMIKSKMNTFNRDIPSEIIDNVTQAPSRTRNHSVLFNTYMFFSILVTLFIPYIFLLSQQSKGFSMNTSFEEIIVNSLLLLIGVFLFFDALNIRKNWKKK